MTSKDDIAEYLEGSQVPSEAGTAERQAGLSVEVVRDGVQFAALRERWTALAESSQATVYQTHEWLSAWWKYFKTERCSLLILVFRRSQEIVGIAPFFIEVQSMRKFRLYRSLKLMGDCTRVKTFRGLYTEDGPSDYLDILVAPEAREEVTQELIAYLKDHTHLYDEIQLNNVPERSLLLRDIQPQLVADGYRGSVDQKHRCPRLSVPQTAEEFLKQLLPGTRRKFQQARKKFQQTPMYAIHNVRSLKELPSAFRDLVMLHQQRWNRAGYLGLFADSRFERFQHEIAETFLERGWLWFQVATMAGVRIGARLAFVFNRQYYDYLSGFDERHPWGKSRPGWALLLAMIEDAIEQKAQVVDFLRGEEQYKYELTPEFTRVVSVHLFPPRNERGLMNRVGLLLSKLEDHLHRVTREVWIANIHCKQHGILFFVPYSRFFVHRLTQRFEKKTGNKKAETMPELARVAPRRKNVQNEQVGRINSGFKQQEVNRYFESSSRYWESVYEDRSVEGAVYQLRSKVAIELVKYLQLPSGQLALDLGCGAGETTVRLAQLGLQVHAVDSVDTMLERTWNRVERAGQQASVQVMKTDVHSLPFDSGKYSLVVALGLVPWLHSPTAALKEMGRVLKTRGFLVISSDNKWRLSNLLDPRLNPLLEPLRRFINGLLRMCGLRQPAQHSVSAAMYSTREFNRMLSESGFEVVLDLTLGYGPLTLFGRRILPRRIDRILHKALQHLACYNVPIIGSVGNHHIVVAQHVQEQ